MSTATHTGWLAVNETALWTPHTRHGFVAPPNKTLLLIGNGAAARWGYRQALREGATRYSNTPAPKHPPARRSVTRLRPTATLSDTARKRSALFEQASISGRQ